MVIDINKLEEILPQLTEDILDKKLSYFSEEGKPTWEPLKPNTVKYKPQNKEVFNTLSGRLRDSIQVTYDIIFGEVIIKCTATHAKGDAVIERLIYTYGRDFLNFDEEEMSWIAGRIQTLLESGDE